MAQTKVITAQDAAALVGDGHFVAIQGSGGGIGEPTALLAAIAERSRACGHPRGLTLCHATGLGDVQGGCGTDLLAIDGLVKRDIAGHLGMAPKMGRMIRDDRIESYNFPQGVLSHMYGAVASRKPGVLTKVGLYTYIDPRLEGGRMNDAARRAEQLVEVVELAGEEWLFWPAFRVDVALVRGTTADTAGNVTAEREAAILEGIHIAQAARACGGVVIAQVKHLAEKGSLDPKAVRIPGVCVDRVVVDPAQKQTCLCEYDPSLSGEVRTPLGSIPPLAPGLRRVVALRAAQELFAGAVVNLGYGMPDGVAAVAAEKGLIEELTFTVEQGLVGGRPAGGVVFGSAHNPEAMIHESDQFNFYDGGNLDIAFLGLAQADRAGNVNVSKVGPLLAGCGGFINITQNARKVVFCGSFTAKGLRAEAAGGRLRIEQEGKVRKFVEQVEQITFSGEYARRRRQPVLFVTERAVFALRDEGLVLTEIAPGADLRRDVLGQMGFEPIVSGDVKTMDPSIFSREPGL